MDKGLKKVQKWKDSDESLKGGSGVYEGQDSHDTWKECGVEYNALV